MKRTTIGLIREVLRSKSKTKEYDFTGKTIIPFCTHGDGGAGYIEKTIKHLCPKAHVLTIFASYDNSIEESDLDKWLQKNGLVIPI